jgi:hypothetical protein
MLKGGVSGPHGGPASAPNAKKGLPTRRRLALQTGVNACLFASSRSSSRTRWIAAISAAIGHLTYFEPARYEPLRNAALTAPARLRTPSLS